MSENSDTSDTLYLVDGSGFIFRAYHALPPLTRSDGTPVGAVLGFSNMLVKLLADLKAKYVAVIFDAARKNYRNDIYPEYKANRDDPPEDLVPQFALIRDATKAFGLPCLEMEGYEADDLIATYARMYSSKGKDVVIVGSDKDLMQLINDRVRMYDPMKQKYIGKPEVVDKFGVTPDKVIDVQALAGDSIDNVPGVPGIGVKTAALLINEYGDLETLLLRAPEIKQKKRRENLIEYADKARISKKLVRLEDQVPVPVSAEDMEVQGLGSLELLDFFKDMEFRSLQNRLGEKESDDEIEGAQEVVSGIDLPPMSDNIYTLINDPETLKEWMFEAKDKGILAIDTETTGLTPAKADLCGISIAVNPGQAAYIPVGHDVTVSGGSGDLFSDISAEKVEDQPEQMKLEQVLEIVKPVLEDSSVMKIGHNIKYDLQMFMKHGVMISPVDDTMLISYALDGTSHGHGMDELSETLLGHKTIHFEDVAGKGKKQVTFDKVSIDTALDYAAEDADVTLRLHHILKPGIFRDKMAALYEDVERPLVPVIAQMELTGIKLDRQRLQSMSGEFGKSLVSLEEKIHDLAGHPFNVASPRQIGSVLFDEIGLSGGKKTKTGEWSTTANLLEKLADQGHEIVRLILDWRQMAKLKSTYTDALQEQINPATGRVHTSFSMAGTSTGRLSSSDPNLQNIPIRTEEGRKIREAFIADAGWKILAIDYSQIELRLAAEMAGVDALREAFRQGQDIHSITASQVFGVPLEEMTSDIRRQAKEVNFGIIYGISQWGLAKRLGIEADVAGDFIKRYFSRFPELLDYMERAKEEARDKGFVRTMFGRKCYISGINDRNGAIRAAAERQAINAPIQGSAADIIKLAMIKVPKALDKAGLKGRMLVQVHDELVFEVPENELEKTIEVVKNEMEHVVELGVPLLAEAGFGDNWAKAH